VYKIKVDLYDLYIAQFLEFWSDLNFLIF